MRILIAVMATVLLAGPALAAAPPDASADARLRSSLGANARIARDISGGLRAVRRIAVPTQGPDPRARAAAFLTAHRAALGLGDAVTYEATTLSPRGQGHVVALDATVGGVPVEGGGLTVTLDAAGHVTSVRGQLAALPPLAPARLTRAAAQRAVSDAFSVAAVGAPVEVVASTLVGPPVRAWRVPVTMIPWVAYFHVWVDAATGTILKQAPVSAHQPIQELAR